jgi:hypothetical protein
MFGRRTPPPCVACAAKDQQIAWLERQVELLTERLLPQPEAPPTVEPEPTSPFPDEEPLSSVINNAISRRAQAGTELWAELEEQARLYLTEDLGEDEIARRISTGDWEGAESADANAAAMR